MTQNTYRMGLKHDTKSYRYYRNAVERHWDPAGIDLEPDRERIGELEASTFDQFRSSIARFGAGERAVTEDLSPLALVLEAAEDQLFLTTQLYEEAKHVDFFDRYWQEVVRPAERERGLDPTSPTSDRWFHEEYDELFARNAEAMQRLLDDDTLETRAIALCHYHLAIEGILAQTAYYGLQTVYGPETPETPDFPGLTTGLSKIRGDEGRHVGFGMTKLKSLIDDGVDPQLLHDTVTELLPLVNAITTHGIPEDDGDWPGPAVADLQSYAVEKHRERMAQITDADAAIPDVETLTDID